METNLVPNQGDVTTALRELLRLETGRGSEIGRAPTDEDDNALEMPYTIIFPMRSPMSMSGPPLCAPDADAEFEFQIKCCGKRGDQALWMGDKVRQVIIGRQDGTFKFEFTVPDHKVTMRKPVGSGGRLDREGTIFCVDDSYRINVTAL